MGFFVEVWRGYQPYLAKIAIDFLVTASFWVALFIFKLLTHILPVSGWAGDFIVNLHAAGVVGAIGIFLWLSVNDIIQIHRGTMTCFA